MEDLQTPLTDKTINCIGCRQDFIFTVREQEFFAKMGYQPTRRCISCRAKRRAELNGTEQAGSPVASAPIREELPPTGGKKKSGRGGRRNQDYGDD